MSDTKEYCITAVYKKSIIEKNIYTQNGYEANTFYILHKDTLWGNAIFRVNLTPSQLYRLKHVSRSTETDLTPFSLDLEETIDECETSYRIQDDPDD